MTLAWMDEAACQGHDTGIFFVDRGFHAAERARQICDGCAVRTECLEFGMKEEFGIFGGCSPLERQKLRSERRRASKRQSA